MANPRKFSEKIALHNQKQAEETAAFEEIMREVMGATRGPTVSYTSISSPTSHNNNGINHENNINNNDNQLLHIAPSFNSTRAGSLPNVNQIGQANSNSNSNQSGVNADNVGIDLQSALNNLQEIKNNCLDGTSANSSRDGSFRQQRNLSPLNRSTIHRHSSHNISCNLNSATPSYNNVNQFQFTSDSMQRQLQNHYHPHQHHHQQHLKRSQSPYSTNNNAYLSPPAAESQWRRTNSDSALNQTSLLQNASIPTNQTLEGIHQIIANSSIPLNNINNLNNSPKRNHPAMMIDQTVDQQQSNMYTINNENNSMLWETTIMRNHQNISSPITTNQNSDSNKFLLSASLPDQQLRPRSCEVPGINIYPSQEDNTSANNVPNNSAVASLHHISGSLPDLTNLHFPVPLPSPIDTEEQNGLTKNHNSQQTPNSPFSNEPDSPYSPASSHNSNLSPPPPCNILPNHNSPNNNYHQQNSSRQSSPGPAPSPTAQRRRAHHNVNNLVIGNHRHQASSHHNNAASSSQLAQVCYTQMAVLPTTTYKDRFVQSPSHYINENDCQNQHHYSLFKNPPMITVEGLAMDTSSLNLNGNELTHQYKPTLNMSNQQKNGATNNQQPNNVSPTSPFQQNQFQFSNSQNFQNFSMGTHRSTTPSDSCSAPTSPISQNISPSNSPELSMNAATLNNVGNVPMLKNQVFSQHNSTYTSFTNQQQANSLQHQLEQFKMTNESDSNNYIITCNSNFNQNSGNNTSNVFYLESLSTNQFSITPTTNETVLSPQECAEIVRMNLHTQSHNQQNAQQLFTGTNNSIYLDSDQIIQNSNTNSSNFMKSELINTLYKANTIITNCNNGNQQQLSNSSHCTTPQTPSSIPDIILTGPNNLDEVSLQTSNDFVKDLNSMSNIGSFDSDIFCTAADDIRTGGTFDSFDLDSLQMLPDIDSNTE